MASRSLTIAATVYSMKRVGASSSVYVFGSSEFAQTGQTYNINVPALVQLPHVDSITAGPWQSAAISPDGDLFVWGLINDSNTPDSIHPIKREGNSAVISTPTSAFTNAKAVAIDESRVLVLTRRGDVLSPQIAATVTDVISVHCRFDLSILIEKGKYHIVRGDSSEFEPKTLPHSESPLSAAIYRTGYAILSTDSNLHIFTETLAPIMISDVVSVAASNDRLVILVTNGRVFEVFPNGAKRQVSGIGGNPISVFAGGAHFGCVTFEGDCWTWGNGNRGQLGCGCFTVAYEPAKVVLKENLRVIDAAAGEEHTLLLVVKDQAFAPQLPEPMKNNEYMKMVRMRAALPGAFVASEFDSKF
jgi:alpha-tubulin suppressor-like RCC1 family protein